MVQMRSPKPRRDNTQEQLRFAQKECNRLREENARLRTMLGISESVAAETDSASNAEVSAADSSKSGRGLSTPEGKITLFLNLFRGREDVYAVRWEGKEGKSGYSPAATMDWRAINAARPEERQFVARKTRMLLPLTGEVIRKHLIETVGIYPLLPDETCWFLAVDFDKKSWIADSTAFVQTCRRFHVPAIVERSRSGNGSHVWMFFDRPVFAADAGFDDARLDTLFLTMPISWRGTLQQYVGRLHRLHENKKEVLVYDYADTLVPMLTRMYKKRTAGYSALGYIVAEGTR